MMNITRKTPVLFILFLFVSLFYITACHNPWVTNILSGGQGGQDVPEFILTVSVLNAEEGDSVSFNGTNIAEDPFTRNVQSGTVVTLLAESYTGRSVTFTITGSNYTAEGDERRITVTEDTRVYVWFGAEVTGITVTTQPTLAYTHGDELDLTELVVELTFYNEDTMTVAFADFAAYGLTTNPTDGTALRRLISGSTDYQHNGNPIVITHTASGETANTDYLTVVHRQLALADVSAVSRVFESDNLNVAINYTLEGVVLDDDVNVILEGTIPTHDAGDDITVNFAVSMTGGDAGNYLAPAEPSGITVNITPRLINTAAVTIAAPSPDAAPYPTATIAAGENFTAGNVSWSPADISFQVGEVYTAEVVLTADVNHAFAETDTLTRTINGAPAAVVTRNDAARTITLSLTFPVVTAATVIDIEVTTQPALTYTHGDALDLAGLVVRLIYDDITYNRYVPFAAFAAYGITANPANGAVLRRFEQGSSSYADHGRPIAITHTASGETANTNSLTVNQRQLAISNIGPAARVYDGQTSFPLTGGDLAGVVLNDVVTFVLGSGTTDSPNVGTWPVTVNITLTGADAGNYTLQQPTLNVSITPALIQSVGVTVTAPVIGAVPNFTATIVTGGNFTAGTVSWSPAHNPFQGGTRYTATVTLTANANHAFADTLTAATINGFNAVVAPTGTGRTVITLAYEFPATDGIAPPINITFNPAFTDPIRDAFQIGEVITIIQGNAGSSRTLALPDDAVNFVFTEIEWFIDGSSVQGPGNARTFTINGLEHFPHTTDIGQRNLTLELFLNGIPFGGIFTINVVAP